MADIADVEQKIAEIIAAAVYPTGVPLNGVSPVAGVKCKIERGWPTADEADKNLAEGIARVSVYPKAGGEFNRSRFPREWQDAETAAPTLSFTRHGDNEIQFTGATTKAHNVSISTGDVLYVQAVPVGATLASIAESFAAVIPGATALGAYLDTTYEMRVTVGTFVRSIMELSRRIRHIQIGIFAPTPAARDALGRAIEPALSLAYRFPLPDGTGAAMEIIGTMPDDAGQRAGYFRRDTIVSVEYALTITQDAAQVVATELNVEVRNVTQTYERN